MAGPLDLRGRAVISDGATGTLNAIKGKLDQIGASAKRISTGQYLGNVAHSIQRHATQIAGATTAAGLGIRSIIDSTRDFNESKFGYGFARLTDHIKDGRLDMGAWRKDMNDMARSVIATSKEYGALPAVTMKAREEVEKLGFKGDEAQSIFGAALALHLSEPTALASGEAAKYMGAVYRAYEKQRQELAQKLGKDAEDPAFKSAYIKGLAGKAAVAGAESALGPADIVEGMRQFAPQWAAMGVDYNFALAMLAHGSNFGFRAPELGTAFKSMMSYAMSPTADGMKIWNKLNIDRSKFMTAAPVDPVKAATRINSMLHGALGGKGWRERKQTLVDMLDTAQRQGVTNTPDFQQALTQEVLRMLPRGKGYEGKADEIAQSVQNATVAAQGGLKLPELIKEMRDKGATVGDIATAFERRHVARYTPTYHAYEKLIALYEKIEKAGPEVVDAAVAGRKESEAGKTDQMYGAWQRLMLALEQTGPVDMAKTAITALFDAIAKLPKDVLAIGSGLAAVAAGIVAVGVAAKSLAWLTGMRAAAPAAGAGAGAAAGAASAAAAAGAGGLGLWARMRGWGAGAMKGMTGLSMLAGIMELRGWANAYEQQQWNEIFAKSGRKPPSLGFSAPAQASGASPLAGPEPGGAWEQDGAGGPAGSQGQMQAAVAAAQSAAQQITATFQQIDLTGEGMRIGETLAAGLRSGLASAVAAVEQAGAQIGTAASRINLNTGPAMQGAR